MFQWCAGPGWATGASNCDLSCFRPRVWSQTLMRILAALQDCLHFWDFEGLHNNLYKWLSTSGIPFTHKNQCCFKHWRAYNYKTLEVNQKSMIGIVNCAALIYVFQFNASISVSSSSRLRLSLNQTQNTSFISLRLERKHSVCAG